MGFSYRVFATYLKGRFHNMGYRMLLCGEAFLPFRLRISLEAWQCLLLNIRPLELCCPTINTMASINGLVGRCVYFEPHRCLITAWIVVWCLSACVKGPQRTVLTVSRVCFYSAFLFSFLVEVAPSIYLIRWFLHPTFYCQLRGKNWIPSLLPNHVW